MQAEEAALLAVDMAAAERRIHSALNAHISELREQIESEERAALSEQVKLQVGPSLKSVLAVLPYIALATLSVQRLATSDSNLLCSQNKTRARLRLLSGYSSSQVAAWIQCHSAKPCAMMQEVYTVANVQPYNCLCAHAYSPMHACQAYITSTPGDANPAGVDSGPPQAHRTCCFSFVKQHTSILSSGA